jgi:hypothetical protein
MENIFQITTVGDRNWKTVEQDIRSAFLKLGWEPSFCDELCAELKGHMQLCDLFEPIPVKWSVEVPAEQVELVREIGRATEEAHSILRQRYVGLAMMLAYDLVCLRRGDKLIPLDDARDAETPPVTKLSVIDGGKVDADTPPGAA